MSTVEDYLIRKAQQWLLDQDQFPDYTVDPSSGLRRKLTNWDKGRREGEIQAYLDAIQALRAGSDYFPDQRANLRIELLLQARAAWAQKGAGSAPQ